MDPQITLGNLIAAAAALLAIVVSIITITSQARKNRRENEADAERRTNELKADGFKRSEDIKGAFGEKVDDINATITDLKVSLGERVKALETTTSNFMARAEIEAKIEHEKNNRVHSDEALLKRVDGNTTDIRVLLVDVGSLKERQAGMGVELGEIKLLVKEGNKDQMACMEKLREQISHLSGGQR